MLRVFFEKTDGDTSIYFKDKKIWQCGDYYTQHQGQYPVIFLTFKDAKYSTWEETFQIIRKLIAQEYIRHNELEKSSKLNEYEKEHVKVNLKMLFYGKLKMSFFRHPPRKYLYLSCGMKGH